MSSIKEFISNKLQSMYVCSVSTVKWKQSINLAKNLISIRSEAEEEELEKKRGFFCLYAICYLLFHKKHKIQNKTKKKQIGRS